MIEQKELKVEGIYCKFGYLQPVHCTSTPVSYVLLDKPHGKALSDKLRDKNARVIPVVKTINHDKKRVYNRTNRKR